MLTPWLLDALGFRPLHELDNGFTDADHPVGLQRLCDSMVPATGRGFWQRWLAGLPLPLTEADRRRVQLDVATQQVEVSRTIVFDAPRHVRGFVEALCTDNLDIGHLKQMQMQIRPSGPHPSDRITCSLSRTPLYEHRLSTTRARVSRRGSSHLLRTVQGL